ncbi:hypothetical protein FRB99_007492 [Tulasnella sp. 403]|nr:hypothetical protein FRB99_007492 [Tulasnella sp. 403]
MASAKVIDTILLIGDSLTQGGWQEGGFAQRLAYVYARKLDVVNRGLSGYNSEWAMPVFEQIFPKKANTGPKVRLLVIWFGANDSCLSPSPQHLPLDLFASNIRQMISMVRSPDSAWYSPETEIILITPPPINEQARAADLASRNPPIALDRSVANSKLYVDAVTEIGRENGIPVVDMHDPIWTATGGDPDKLAEYLNDGLHLTKAGYTILYDRLIETIKKSYPELHHDVLPLVYKHWTELDWKNPRAYLEQ